MKKILSLIYKAAIIAATVYGLYLNFSHSGFLRMIVYFTIISNIFVLVFFSVQLVCELLKFEKTKKYYIFKLILLTNILITMFAFEFVIRPYISIRSGYSSNNNRDQMVHLVVPIMTFFDYILFDEKGKLKLEYTQYVAISPMLYLVFCFIYAKLGGTFTAFKSVSKYPYIFMDFELYGNFVYLYYLLVMLIFIGIACEIVFVDNFLKSKKKRKP